jgi:hypothetical protein
MKETIEKLVIEEMKEGVYRIVKHRRSYDDHFTCDRGMALLTLYGVHKTQPQTLCCTRLIDIKGFHNDYVNLYRQIDGTI